jgi:hypothetical protein
VDDEVAVLLGVVLSNILVGELLSLRHDGGGCVVKLAELKEGGNGEAVETRGGRGECGRVVEAGRW